MSARIRSRQFFNVIMLSSVVKAAARAPRLGGLRQSRLLKRRSIGYDAESRRS
jgi:hypothetical protein